MRSPESSRRRPVRYGDGAIREVAGVVAGHGVKRVLLVCGARSFEASGAAGSLPDLERVAQVRRWDDFAPNTDAADLLRGLRLADIYRPDLVLGIGGGSALDMAKLLCAFAGVTDQAKLHDAIRSGESVAGRDLGLVLAPTTSGSGSEATHFAVVYIGDDKFSVAGPALRPDAVILDPALARSGSAYQRATSGIDAVAQAIESLWAVGSTEHSRRWARHALGLLLPAIEEFVTAATEGSARAMAIGSHLAGRAIDVSRTTGAHALSYAITKRHGISHGHAVALTLGAFIELHAHAPAAMLQDGVDPQVHAGAMAEILTALGGVDGPAARARFVDLLRRLGLTSDLPGVGASGASTRATIARSVNAERLSNNPVRLTTHQLAALMEDSQQ